MTYPKKVTILLVVLRLFCICWMFNPFPIALFTLWELQMRCTKREFSCSMWAIGPVSSTDNTEVPSLVKSHHFGIKSCSFQVIHNYLAQSFSTNASFLQRLNFRIFTISIKKHCGLIMGKIWILGFITKFFKKCIPISKLNLWARL